MADTVISVGGLEATRRKRARLQGMTDRLEAERAANLKALKAGGYVERNPGRFNADGHTNQVYTGGKRAPTPITAPNTTPINTPLPVRAERVRIDETAARVNYAAYENTARSGGERARALLLYAIAVGIVPSTSCGFRSQAECDAARAHIISEQSVIKYGFDASGSIAAKANASRSLSNNRP